MVIVLILAGGRGERFWPKSRKNFPKHLLKFYGQDSLFTQTIKRAKGLVKYEHIWVATNQTQAGLIKKSWKGKFPFHFLIEPEGRNTAAAIGLAAIRFKKSYGPEAVMVVLSADHRVGKTKEFKDSLRASIDLAEREKGLVTIGVKALRPEAGFGYLEKGDKHSFIAGAFRVKSFIEKPEISRAKKLLESSRYLWNSGIFVWTVEEILSAFKKHLPGHSKLLSQIEKKRDYSSRALRNIYHRFESISIDYGIMEKAKNVWMMEGKFIWDDVGSWVSWARLKGKRAGKNITIGEVIPIDTKDSIIWSDKQLVAALGIKNLIVIADKDVVLVCAKDRAQEIKKIVSGLNQRKKWQRYV